MTRSKGADRLVHVLLGLRQAEREVALGIARRFRHARARPLDGLRAAARLCQRQREAVVGAGEVRPRRDRAAIGVDGRIERPDPLERLSQPLLHVRVARRQPGRFPEQRQRRRLVAVGLELNGARVEVFGGLLRRARSRASRTSRGAFSGDSAIFFCCSRGPTPASPWGPTPMAASGSLRSRR